MMKFIVEGKITGKGRPRFAKAGRFVKAYTPEDTALYENLVKLSFRTQGGIYSEKPLEMTVTAYHDIPKSVSRKQRERMAENKVLPTKKPDADNIAKIICDALNGMAYKDDTQIVRLHVFKKYTDGAPYTEVTIKEIL